jgi:uncharacterized protein with beta-barrel porin domain
MARIGFSRNIILLLTSIIVWSLSNSAIAVTETFPVAGSNNTLAVSGDDVALTGQGASSTINIPNNFNLGVSAGGYSVTSQAAINTGIVNFLGNSVVSGAIGGGASSQVLADIIGGAAGTTVTFNGAVNTVAIDFTAASTMAFNATSSGAVHFNSFNGTVTLGTGVTFNGAATTGATGTGIITLNSGSLYNGAIGAPAATMNTINLNGNASINGQIVAQNIVLGANTLTQTGAVIFPAGATLTIRALSDTIYGNIAAAGQAITFNPGLTVNVLTTSGIVLSGTPLQVVTGTGAGNAPITVTSDNVRFTFTGVNPAGTGNVILTPTIVFPIIPATVPVVVAPVIVAFNSAAFGSTGDFLFVQNAITALNNLTAIGAATAQLSPIVTGGATFMTFEAVNQFQNLWATNLADARGAHMCSHPCSCHKADLFPCHNRCEQKKLRGKKREMDWRGDGVWIDGFGYFANQSKYNNLPGYKGDMWGVMLGMQKPIDRHWQAGIGVGFAHTDVDNRGYQNSGTNINTTEATAYLGYDKDRWFLDNFFTFAWNHYNGYRDIRFPGIKRTASIRADGQAYGLLMSGGYNYFYRGYTITPIASLQYIRMHVNGYTETGAQSVNLIEKTQNYDMLQSGLGAKVGYPFRLCESTLYTEVHAKWLHNIKSYQVKHRAAFSGARSKRGFEVLGASPQRDQADLGLSATLFTAGKWALKAGYDVYLAEKFVGQEGSALITYRF